MAMLWRQQWLEVRRQRSRLSSVAYLFWLYLEVALLTNEQSQRLDVSDERLQFRYWFPHIQFDRLRLLDPLRFMLQSAWLMLFKISDSERDRSSEQSASLLQRLNPWQYRRQVMKKPLGFATGMFGGLFTWLSQHSALSIRGLGLLLTIISAATVVLVISLPMDARDQGLMLLFFWGLALWVRNVKGRIPMMLMILLSVIVSTRYLFWRMTQTINWDIPLDAGLGILLLFAEVYAWAILILGYIQTIWPLQRRVASLPADRDEWPSVDIYIPSYNEPLSVVRGTVIAATALEWPADKLNIYVLDDGKRPDFKAFCEQIGVGYIVRKDNSHAKAGNLNHAMQLTSGDYIAIFDCDHIPSRGFLQLTLGWFYQDDKLALVQTPHHFFSADPFERNLSVFRSRPNEGELFYGLIQDGNDMWNASFFCGSCAVLKRGPLLEVGGIAVETVTEDAHTALKLHRLGYNSAYLNVPLAAGLATESLSAHIGQRIRWARGMAQIFRLDNPLRGKGLTWGQRICYLNAMMYFLNGIPRTIFLLAPLAFLLLGSYIVFAPAVMIAIYAIPHLIHANLANSRSQGAYRHSFWAEMYETVLAWYILRPTTVALFAPEHGKFNVTAKGGLTEQSFFDWQISKPYLVLVGLSLVGLGFGIWRLVFGPEGEYLTVSLNLLWIFYNLIILGGAVAVAEEAKQVRSSHRIKVNRPVNIITHAERNYAAELVDFSDGGAGLRCFDELPLAAGDMIQVVMRHGNVLQAFDAKVVSSRGLLLGIRFQLTTIEAERAFMRATFGRADAWVGWRFNDHKDQPLSSLREIFGIGIRGYQRIALQVAPMIAPLLAGLDKLWTVVVSVLPQAPGTGERDDVIGR